MGLICCVLLLVILSISSNSIAVQVYCIMGGELILSKLYFFCFQFIMLPNTILMSHYGIASLRNDLAEWHRITKRQAFSDGLKIKQPLWCAWWHEGCWVELNCCQKQLPLTTIVELIIHISNAQNWINIHYSLWLLNLVLSFLWIHGNSKFSVCLFK